jgi:hypothetical protein
MGEGPQGGGFTGADVAGDESGQAFLEGKGQPALDLLMTVSREEVGRGDRATERGLGEAEKVIESCQ